MSIALHFLGVVLSILFERDQFCPIKKAHAYQRATIPGNIPRKKLDESGKETEVPIKLMNTYFIYVETGNKCTLKATRLWIGEKAYHVSQEEVSNLPVVIQPSNPGTIADTLVKYTVNKVFRIQPGEELQLKPGKKIPSQQPGTKIVIEYSNNSGTDYYRIQDIKRIAPMILQ